MAKKVKRREQEEQSKEIRNVLLIASLLAAGVGIYWLTHRPPTASAPTPPLESQTPTKYEEQGGSAPRDSRIPPYFDSTEAAKPFPRLLPAAYFLEKPLVARAYQVASEIPEVIAQQPCYCFCDKYGHASLLDCYASDHGAG